MSGYTRGGVQLSGFRAAPAVLPSTSTTSSNANNTYATYTNGTTHYATTQNTGYPALQYQQYTAQYGGGYTSATGYNSTYTNNAQRMPSTVNDDYERE